MTTYETVPQFYARQIAALERDIANADCAYEALRKDYVATKAKLDEQTQRCAKLEARLAELEATP